ncbi:hypothetical protein NX059_005018 [Plenodomus lindquistii]|nr:hypothetical protein NX059_005018 [Plenodomus lindquistii]
MHLTTLISISLFPTLIFSHGLIISPPSRPVGPSIASTCGPAVAQNIRSDNTSHVEGLPELLASSTPSLNTSACNLWLCKGLQFADNANNTQLWYAGQIVPVKVWLRIPHEGSANVSIVDTKSDGIIGDMLKVWPSGYAPGKTEADVPLDQREFSVTVPEGLEDRCGVAGDCVLQWWWYGVAAKQTYESCVDFRIVKKGLRKRALRA